MSEEIKNENVEEVEDVEGVEEPAPEVPRELKDYEMIESRLKEIERTITTENLDMDESLKLYEEAVDLGMKASQTIENNVLVDMNNQTEEESQDNQVTEE